MRTSRFSDEQVLQILQEAQVGTAVKVLCAKHNISPATFRAWKRKFGWMNVSEVWRLRALSEENARLNRLVADKELQIQILQEVNGKMVSPSVGRRAARASVHESGHPAAAVCRALTLPRSAFYRLPRRSPRSRKLEQRAVELSERHPRYSYRRITALMRRAGEEVNPKRVQRVRAEAGLRGRKRQRKARGSAPRRRSAGRSSIPGTSGAATSCTTRRTPGPVSRSL